MKKIVFILMMLLVFAVTAEAKFCLNCGYNLPDDAKFCSKCGKQQSTTKVKKAIKKKVITKSVLEKAKERLNKASNSKNKFYRAKTDIFLYEKRGDELNVLKKNLFFRPRRYRMKRNQKFKILEVVGKSYLVQSAPNRDGHTLQGWVYEEQLELRSNWKK